MKKIMTLVSAIMMVATANAEIKNVTAFNEVNVNVPARVRVIKGNFYGIMVSSDNEQLSKAVNYSVEDGILKISSYDESVMEGNSKEMIITVTTPEDANLSTGRRHVAKAEKKNK